MVPELSEFEKKLNAEGHLLVQLIKGGIGFKLKLSKQHIEFLKPAIHPDKLLWASRHGYYTKLAFPLSLLESIYKKFFDPRYQFKIDESLAPAFCILADATKRAMKLKKPKTKDQDYSELREMQERMSRNEFPKTIIVKYPGREDSYVISDPAIVLNFWESFLNNVEPIEISEPIPVETLLFNTLHPVIGSVTNTHLVIVDLLKIAGSKKSITAVTIEKRIRDQAKLIRQKPKKSSRKVG